MRAQGRERWLPLLLSVLFHSAILAALGWGWWTYRRPAQTYHMLAIEGTVVTRSPVPSIAPAAAAAPAPAPAAAPAASPDRPPEAPAPAAAAQHQAEAQAAAKAAEERQAVAARAEEQASAAREARAAAEAARAAAAEAARKAQAEAQRAAQAAAAEQAAQKREALERQAREAELRSQLDKEERTAAARTNGQLDQYKAMMQNHMQRQWIRPPTTPPQMVCEVIVREVPGGEVTSVQFGSCNASAVVRQSLEEAAYRASPLPAPPTPDLFEPEWHIFFHGSE